jgi:hypothetical protein
VRDGLFVTSNEFQFWLVNIREQSRVCFHAQKRFHRRKFCIDAELRVWMLSSHSLWVFSRDGALIERRKFVDMLPLGLSAQVPDGYDDGCDADFFRPQLVSRGDDVWMSVFDPAAGPQSSLCIVVLRLRPLA